MFRRSIMHCWLTYVLLRTITTKYYINYIYVYVRIITRTAIGFCYTVV